MTSVPVRHRHKDRGAALLLVLWGATVMSVIAAASARESTQIATSANAGAELTRARALADAGVRVGWNAWADDQFDLATGILNCRAGDGGLSITVRTEKSKADLNTSSEPLLGALFRAAGADDALSRRLAASVIDYRDSDSERTDNGAERDDYEAAGLGWAPRDGAFEAIEELGYIPGMVPALYTRVRNDITVFSGTSEIDYDSASPLMLSALADYAAAITDAGMEMATPPRPGIAGSRVSRPSRATSGASSTQRASIRAVAVTDNGAVFVREAVVAAPGHFQDAPRFMRLAQGRIEAGERLPDLSDAPPCAPGLVN
jgi:general secretion pathway protein K